MSFSGFKKLGALALALMSANCYPMSDATPPAAASAPLISYRPVPSAPPASAGTHQAARNAQPAAAPSAFWLDKLARLAHGRPEKFRILQIGDSHTAGDFFTNRLRTRLQNQWGNGGIGWVYPHQVAGQQIIGVRYSEGQDWQVFTTRKDSDTFPLGGILARSDGASFSTIQAASATSDSYRITFTARPLLAESPLSVVDGRNQVFPLSGSPGNNSWQYLTLENAYLPISYQTAPGNIWEIGYINIENHRPGIVLSSMGINGSQWTSWEKWRPGWTRDLAETHADLVIIAYGTNEAFNSRFNAEEAYRQWTHYIDLIRDTLPNAGILIVGAPESLKNQQGECGSRPELLSEVQTRQQRLAQEKNLLYWSWQQAMGGECTMKNWIRLGLARSDGVHFTKQGYQAAADILADQIIALAKRQQP